MSDSSNRASPGPLVLPLRAAFVPDGAQPPPEFSGVFDPLTFRATRDPATGMITCDNAGISFDGDVRAEWHPDAEEGSAGGQEASGQDGGAKPRGPDVAAQDGQPDRTGASADRPGGDARPARPDDRTSFGLAGGHSKGASPSLPKGLYPDATGRAGEDRTNQPPAAAPTVNVAAAASVDDVREQPGAPKQSGDFARGPN